MFAIAFADVNISGETFHWHNEHHDDGFISPAFSVIREFLMDEEWDAAAATYDAFMENLNGDDGLLMQFDGAILTIAPFKWFEEFGDAADYAYSNDGHYVIDIVNASHLSIRG